MRRALVISALFLCLPCTLFAGGLFSNGRFHIGLGWGGSGTVLTAHHYNYLDQSIGFRIDDSGTQFGFRPHGYAELSFVYDAGEHLTLAVAGGYEGLADGRCIVPFKARISYYLSGIYSDGIFLSGESGVPVRKRAGNAFLVQAGPGYRLALGGGCSMDFKLGVKMSYDHPKVWDPVEEEYISARNILRNNAWYYALTLGVSLEF